ncbi:MAG TPA: FUSC family protein [Candidatus Acidoferrales bacterium]|nr:FUSC family protein [Candidatus Acidoferrales bacterium]
MVSSSTSIPLRPTRQDLVHVVRTTTAALVSLLVARLLKLPEAYWATITTLVVMQSTLGAAFTVSWHRFIGSAIGAAAGALLATYFGANAAMFAVGIFVIGIVCAALRLDRIAYRFAGVTLAIVMLVAYSNSPWRVAVHRFIEVSVGIVVALAIAAIWPEAQPASNTPAS